MGMSGNYNRQDGLKIGTKQDGHTHFNQSSSATQQKGNEPADDLVSSLGSTGGGIKGETVELKFSMVIRGKGRWAQFFIVGRVKRMEPGLEP